MNADKKNIVFLHVAFWLLFLIVKFVDYQENLGTPMSLKYVAVQNAFNLVAAYVHYFVLLPLFFPKRSYIKYTLGLLLLFGLAIYGRGLLEAATLGNEFSRGYYTTWTFNRVLSMAWNMASFVFFIALLKFTIDRFILERQKKALENEKLTAELNYLKAQINPHFLFNTLHNLSYLAQVENDKAVEVIMKLSNIMRYMIYESNKPRVPLYKELRYLQDYLDLEGIRLNHRFKLSFDTSEVDDQLEIAPMVLIPFVENAFKHGVSDQHEDCWIRVRLSSSANVLDLEVENRILLRNGTKEEGSGFGLANVKKRLALGYPNQHQLTIDETNEEFKVHLHLTVKA